MNPVEVLEQGATILAPTLVPAGFQFIHTGSGHSSGGNFASGEFRRKDHRLELHVRFSLGLVRYHVGDVTLGHEDFVRAVRALRGVPTVPAYPGFSDLVLDSFRHLRTDIEQFGEPFVHGISEEFLALVEWVSHHPRPKGLAELLNRPLH